MKEYLINIPAPIDVDNVANVLAMKREANRRRYVLSSESPLNFLCM